MNQNQNQKKTLNQDFLIFLIFQKIFLDFLKIKITWI